MPYLTDPEIYKQFSGLNGVSPYALPNMFNNVPPTAAQYPISPAETGGSLLAVPNKGNFDENRKTAGKSTTKDAKPKDGGMWDSLLTAFASGMQGAYAPRPGMPVGGASVGQDKRFQMPGGMGATPTGFNSILARYLLGG